MECNHTWRPAPSGGEYCWRCGASKKEALNEKYRGRERVHDSGELIPKLSECCNQTPCAHPGVGPCTKPASMEKTGT